MNKMRRQPRTKTSSAFVFQAVWCDSGKSHRPLTPTFLISQYPSHFYCDVFAKYAPPLAEIRIYRNTAPMCITMRLPFVSRSFAEVLRSGVVGASPSNIWPFRCLCVSRADVGVAFLLCLVCVVSSPPR